MTSEKSLILDTQVKVILGEFFGVERLIFSLDREQPAGYKMTVHFLRLTRLP